MQFTKDMTLKLYKHNNKEEYLSKTEDFYFKLTIIVSLIALIVDFFLIKQFINILIK